MLPLDLSRVVKREHFQYRQIGSYLIYDKQYIDVIGNMLQAQPPVRLLFLFCLA